MITPITAKLAHLTADLPGIGGRIKVEPEDFLVEELPLYTPSGRGEHLYLFIQKRTMTTTDVVRRLAKLYKVKRSHIGYAGMKDKHAVTRQHFSIWLPRQDKAFEDKCIHRFEFLPFDLLWADRHDNKLRRGHLKGNRFVICIRDVQATDVVRAKAVLDRLLERGMPDYLGQQRFGARQNNHLIGRSLLQENWQEAIDEMLGRPREGEAQWAQEARRLYEQDDYRAALEKWPRILRTDRQALDALRQGKDAEAAIRAMDHVQQHFFISAFQSYLFNLVLDRRVRESTFDRLVPGDLAWKHENRSLFAVDEATAEKENGPGGRVPHGAVSPSGPLWSDDMPRCSGEPDKWELEALHHFGLTVENLARRNDRRRAGVRRPCRVFASNADISGGADERGPYIRLAFDLPRGAFATVLTREIMKNDVGGDELADDD